MATQIPGDYPINANTTSGLELTDILNRFQQAEASQNATTTRPSYITRGGLWVKDSVGNLSMMMYDGTIDIEIFLYSGGNIYTPMVSIIWLSTRTYSLGELVTDGEFSYISKTTNVGKQPSLNPNDWNKDTVVIANNLTTTSTTAALSAYQGYLLQEYKIEKQDYATSNSGGTLKTRLTGTQLFITNNGQDA